MFCSIARGGAFHSAGAPRAPVSLKAQVSRRKNSGGGVLSSRTLGFHAVRPTFLFAASQGESDSTLQGPEPGLGDRLREGAENVAETVSNLAGSAKENIEEGVDQVTRGTPLDAAKGRGTQAVLEQQVMVNPEGHPGPHAVGNYLYQESDSE